MNMRVSEDEIENYLMKLSKGKDKSSIMYNKGRGFGSKSKVMYLMNQKGSGIGSTLVTPIAQNIQQAKSEIKHNKGIKRFALGSAGSHSAKRRRKRVKRKKSKKKSKKGSKSKKHKKKRKLGKKTKSKRKSLMKKKKKRKKSNKRSKKDIFG